MNERVPVPYYSPYELLNRLLTSEDALNITVTNTYDQVGNKLTVEDGNTTPPN